MNIGQHLTVFFWNLPFCRVGEPGFTWIAMWSLADSSERFPGFGMLASGEAPDLLICQCRPRVGVRFFRAAPADQGSRYFHLQGKPHSLTEGKSFFIFFYLSESPVSGEDNWVPLNWLIMHDYSQYSKQLPYFLFFDTKTRNHQISPNYFSDSERFLPDCSGRLYAQADRLVARYYQDGVLASRLLLL